MTQEEKVLSCLKEGRKLNCMIAFRELGITKLATKVSTLKKWGHPITKKTIVVPTRYGKAAHIAEYHYSGNEQPVQSQLDL